MIHENRTTVRQRRAERALQKIAAVCIGCGSITLKRDFPLCTECRDRSDARIAELDQPIPYTLVDAVPSPSTGVPATVADGLVPEAGGWLNPPGRNWP